MSKLIAVMLLPLEFVLTALTVTVTRSAEAPSHMPQVDASDQ